MRFQASVCQQGGVPGGESAVSIKRSVSRCSKFVWRNTNRRTMDL